MHEGENGDDNEVTNQSRTRDLEGVSVSHLAIDLSQRVRVQSMLLFSVREKYEHLHCVCVHTSVALLLL